MREVFASGSLMSPFLSRSCHKVSKLDGKAFPFVELEQYGSLSSW